MTLETSHWIKQFLHNHFYYDITSLIGIKFLIKKKHFQDVLMDSFNLEVT